MNQNFKLNDLAKLFTKKPILLINNLTLFYSEYKNSEKIIKLLIIFLSQYYFFFKQYNNSKNFKKLLISKKSFFSIAEELDCSGRGLTKPKKNIIYSFLSLFIASFLNDLVLRGYNYDSEKIFGRYLAFISKFFLRYLPSRIDLNRKKTLIGILSKHFSSIEIKYLSIVLQDIFFSKPINLLSKKDKLIKTSCTVFWDFDGYEKILLIQNKIIIHGVQHGGGYDLKKDLLRCSEVLIADFFYSWGFGVLNMIQHRYKRFAKNSSKKKINRILWIERSCISKLFKFFMPDYYAELQDSKIINIIETELKNKKRKFRIPYRNRLSNLYRNSKIKIISDQSIPEFIIKNDDLVIFDNINQSLIYFCIQNDISFLCGIDLKKYSKNYDKNYINFLKSKKVIFDCNNGLKNNLKKLRL